MAKKKTEKKTAKVVAEMKKHIVANEFMATAPDTIVSKVNTVEHLSPGEIAFAIKDICSAILDIRSRIDRIVEAHEKCKSLRNL